MDGIQARKLRDRAKRGLVEVASRMDIAPSYLCDLEHNRKDWNFKLEKSFIKAINYKTAKSFTKATNEIRSHMVR